ncbi:MAG: DUF484 family protein [SAR86 cluster bacterium]|nr:DUF484 family protein [SAR86 cluster bacterium]
MSDKKRHNPSAKEVADYLILNPNFFKENPEVLNSIEIVHDSGAAVSLIQRQVELLRTDYNSTTDKLMELLANAKNNDDIFILTKKLILDLIDASNIEEITALLEKRFKKDFGADESRLMFFTESNKNIPKGRIKNPVESADRLAGLMKPGESFYGEVKQDITQFIFNDETAIKEVALIPLTSNTLKGMIALGSVHQGKYTENKDTLFLDFVAEVVSGLIDNHNS